MDVDKGREQDAVSFARHSQDHQYPSVVRLDLMALGLTLSDQIFNGLGIKSRRRFKTNVGGQANRYRQQQ